MCIPGHHISLGVLYQLFCLFEDAAHQLDVLIATGLGHSRSSTQLQDGTQFHRHIEAMQTVTTLIEKVNELEAEAEFYESLLTWTTLSGQDQDEDEDPDIAAMRREIELLKKKAAEMVKYEIGTKSDLQTY